MKYLITWEWKPEEVEKCWKLYEKQRNTKYESSGETLFPQHHIIGKNKGFSIVDIENMENYTKIIDEWAELLVFNLYPIIETSKLYELHKKT